MRRDDTLRPMLAIVVARLRAFAPLFDVLDVIVWDDGTSAPAVYDGTPPPITQRPARYAVVGPATPVGVETFDGTGVDSGGRVDVYVAGPGHGPAYDACAAVVAALDGVVFSWGELPAGIQPPLDVAPCGIDAGTSLVFTEPDNVTVHGVVNVSGFAL